MSFRIFKETKKEEEKPKNEPEMHAINLTTPPLGDYLVFNGKEWVFENAKKENKNKLKTS